MASQIPASQQAGPSSQFAASQYASSQHPSTQTQSSPPPLPRTTPILSGPTCYGPLHNLHSQVILEDESFCILSSSYRQAETPAEIKSPSRSRRSRSKSKGPPVCDGSEAGTWQLRAARIQGSAIVWYCAVFRGGAQGEIKDLVNKSKSSSWHALETRIHAAWQANDVHIGVLKRHQKSDGTWDRMQLILGQQTPTESQSQSQSPPLIRLTLDRISEDDEEVTPLALATHLCADLIRTNTILHSSLARTQSKLSHARVLAGIDSGTGGIGPSGGSASQGHSLVNPGRVKRKREDDEGFEGDSEEGTESETDEEG